MKKIKIIIACIAIIATYLSVNAFISNPDVASVPSVPVLSSPSNGATNVSLTPKLQVVNSTGGSGPRLYHFQLTLSSDASFSSPIIDVTNISEGASNTLYTVPASMLNNSIQYIWRAECFTVLDGASGFPSAFSFTTIP